MSNTLDNKIYEAYKNLSLSDKLAFKELTKYKAPIYLITFPFYTIFYLGVYGLVMKYAFNIEILRYLLIIAGFMFKLYNILILVFFISIIKHIATDKKNKAKLLNVYNDDEIKKARLKKWNKFKELFK